MPRAGDRTDDRSRDDVGTSVVDGHHHVVKFFASDQELVGEIAEFAWVGLADGGSFLMIARPEHRQALEVVMAGQGFDVLAAVADGRYVAVDAGETLASFLVDGRPDRELFSAVVGGLIGRLRPPAGGTEQIRAFGEMVSLLWDEGRVVEALELEELWNGLIAETQIYLFCGYPLDRVSPKSQLGSATAVCNLHSRAIPPRRYEHQHSAWHYAEGTTWRLFFPTPASLAAVRWFVRSYFGDVDEQLLDDACLVATELATNALYHVKSPYAVGLQYDDGTVRISVRDVSPDLPAVRIPLTTAARGRGLPIVEQVSLAWGCDRADGGKVVWAQLEA